MAHPLVARRFRGVDRSARAAASRELRDVVIHGWDADAIAAALGPSRR